MSALDVNARAARVWCHRERIEYEAAGLFEVLARELASVGWPDLASRALTAADDERRHGLRCRALVESLGGLETPRAAPPARVILGPSNLRPRDRVLYAAVAVGCITESLSCALLLELREVAVHPLVVATVAEILRDEIEHARIGWAVLAAEAVHSDVSWLSAYVPAMRAAAVADEIAPMSDANAVDLGALGVLPRDRIGPLVTATWNQVISPGLERHGIRA